ncbi:hypothetical protein CTAYLR_002031 [Chrysophaeum taylorii]|uniref:BSD domain-containing protein n=1 Tax=Chrysophaeum taylorii TaxID=2483200 RepID=A0AAD7XRB3_9STRA|nr:hypothetical protein CTAYLR_002031 [Chrysophaeum taylorii]
MAAGDDLLYRFRAAYQKQDGTVEITARGVTWKSGENGVEVPFTSLEKHEVSPKDHPKAMLKLSRVSGKPIILTVREATPERAYAVLSAAKVTISTVQKKRKRSSASSSFSSAAAFQKKKKLSEEEEEEEEGAVVPEAASSRIAESRRALLQADERLSVAYREVVGGELATEEQFWAAHATDAPATTTARLVSNELLDGEPEAEEKTVRYTLNTEKIEYIFEMYPAVERAYAANVPKAMSPKEFWVRYFQSRYYLRDKGAAVAASRAGELQEGGDDIFAGFERPEDRPSRVRVSRALDLTKTAGDRDVTEAPDEPPETSTGALPGALDPRPDLVVAKFNRHASIVLSKVDTPATDAELVETADMDELRLRSARPVHTLALQKAPTFAQIPTHAAATKKSSAGSSTLLWSPRDVDPAAALDKAKNAAATAVRVLRDKSRPPGTDAPPDEPFRSEAEAKCALVLELLHLDHNLAKSPATSRANLHARLAQLKGDIDQTRHDLLAQSTKVSVERAAMLQPLAAQISYALRAGGP